MARKTAVKSIGVLTAGGDCPGLNAVLRAVVKTCVFEYGMRVRGFKDGYAGLIYDRSIQLDTDDVSGILTLGGTIIGTSNRANPFRAPVRRKGRTVYADVSRRAIRTFRKHQLDALVCIGGDGMLNIAHRLSKLGVPVVGVPKTIDNDLNETDVTFGFHTAVQTATEAIDRLHTTAMSHHRVMVLEVMGRYAGWIALAAGMAGGGDVILIPEIPYVIGHVCKRVQQRNRKGKRFSIVVVAEGAHPKGGKVVVKEIVKDSTDPFRLGGVGRQVATDIERRTGIVSRVTVLGHLQRGGTPTAYDRILATRYGVETAHALARGEFGVMVALHGTRIVTVPLSRAAGKPRLVPADSDMVAAAISVGTCFGNCEACGQRKC